MNKYEVQGVVGEGAYGVVLKCKTHETLEIFKFFWSGMDSDDDEHSKRNITREVRMLRMLKHENVVELKEAFRSKGKMYLVFEYAEQNLLEIIEQQPKGLQSELIRRLIYQLCKAINYLHEQNVVHRDIKPENLLVNSKGILKLCDFGFARSIPASGTGLTEYVATRWYRPPELLLGTNDYGRTVDMWAIGCIMGELTDGQPLFPGENEFDQLHIIQKVLGSLCPSHKELFSLSKRFQGKNFSDVSKPETLDQRYLGKMSKKAISFMKALLKLDPTERLAAAEALRHPYFEGMSDSDSSAINRKEVNKNPSNFKPEIASNPELQIRKKIPNTILKSENLKESLEKPSFLNDQNSGLKNKEINKAVEDVSQREKTKVSETHGPSNLNKNPSQPDIASSTQQKSQFRRLKKTGLGSFSTQTPEIPESFMKTRYDGTQYNYVIEDNSNALAPQFKEGALGALKAELFLTKRATIDTILRDKKEANTNRPPSPILQKNYFKHPRQDPSRQVGALTGSTARDTFDIHNKSPRKFKNIDLKPSKPSVQQKPSHLDEKETTNRDSKPKIEGRTEETPFIKHQLPKLNLKSSELQKSQSPEVVRSETYTFKKLKQKESPQAHTMRSETESSTNYENKYINGASDNVQYYSFRVTPGLWKYKSNR